MENIEKTGTYSWHGDHSYVLATATNMLSDEQGRKYMVFRVGATLHVVSFGDTATAEPTVKEIPLAGTTSSISDFAHISLRNNILEATFNTFESTNSYLTYWIDMASNSMIAYTDTARPAQSLLRAGDSMLYVTKYDYTGSELTMLTPQSDGTVQVTYSKGTAQLLETQSGTPVIVPLSGTGEGYFTDPVTGKQGRSALFVQGKTLEQAILTHSGTSSGTSSTAQEPWTYKVVPATRSTLVAQTHDVMAATVMDNAAYMLTVELEDKPENAEARYFITRFDAKGKQNGRVQLNDPTLFDDSYSKTFDLQAAPNGYLALVCRQIHDRTEILRTITTLISSDMKTVSVTGIDPRQQAIGWLYGRWAYVTPATSETAGMRLNYAMTKILDVSPSPVPPSDPSTPDKPSAPESRQQGNAATATKALMRTGTAVPFMLAIALALAGVTVLAVAKASSRRQRK